jgi:uncharacterized Zn-binding protein involved in type VI secretion
MGPIAAKQGDRVVATDMHLIQPPAPVPPSPVPHPFSGPITLGCVPDVLIEGRAAAVVGSVALNQPPHVPIGGSFVIPPRNRGTIVQGSATVLIGGQPAARAGDAVSTCNDPVDLPVGHIVAAGTVFIGG